MAAHDDAEARASKRARLTTPPAGDAVDLISGLDDDVLLRVLSLLPDASDAVRTGALSRRWRGLWARVAALRFASRPASESDPCAALERYVSFVDGVLARRTRSDCAIEDLAISYTTDPDEHYLKLKQLMLASFPDDEDVTEEEEEEDGYYYGSDNDGKNGHGYKGCQKEPEVVLLDELPTSPTRLEAFRLALGGATLRLPTTVKFASLTDLSLERMKIPDGGAHLLARLVSPASCPRLTKLRMIDLWVPDPSDQEMRLEANVLSELWMEDVTPLRSLELKTPNLRILHIDACYSENDINVVLLNQCISVTCLAVTLRGPKVFKEDMDIISNRVPHLPQITSLIINVTDWAERHDFGAGVASLLTRFNNLRRLSLQLPVFDSLWEKGANALCDRQLQKCHWTSYEISMAHPQEVELTGLTGAECELSFVKVVFASAKRLYKVAISFNPKCQHPGRMDAFERMLLDGAWTIHRGAFMLTAYLS
ncbi:hypothetical protein HU200_035663 [Digitaria exilis]|uniref:F-box domain-containing protein n=1 Tax=Digitaria exilis TaxID=1010633 RepID=A0A835BGD3_9POAL|nr:hypothetical protein HU200_035663 [Digitaria exilis]